MIRPKTRTATPRHRHDPPRGDGRFTGDPAAVSARMRLIRSSNTKPEKHLFVLLDAAAIPYEAHVRIEGVSVDALVTGRVAVFVDSPFWHLRSDGELDRLSVYWRDRLLSNRARDRRQTVALRRAGYAVVRMWSDEVGEASAWRRLRQAIRRVRPRRLPE